MSQTISAGRQVAFKALQRYERGMAADEALSDALSQANLKDPRDRALATTLVFGTIRRWATIDHIIEQYSRRPLTRIDRGVLTALRLGVYQIMWLDRVPGHAVVNETVTQVKKIGGRGAAGFANAVLRSLLRSGRHVVFPSPEEDLVAHLSIVHSHPAWLVKRYLSRLGRQETEALLAANNTPPEVTVRVNRRRAVPQHVMDAFRRHGAHVEPGRYLPEALRVRAQTSPSELPGFNEGLFTPQDEGSMLVPHALQPAAGERILDACAAPGTKTSQIAELMDDNGTTMAFDRDHLRLELVRENARRLGLQSVETRVVDARYAVDVLGHAWADRVLVDAPCSGLGTLARRPDLRWRKRPEDIPSLAQLQGEILDGVAPVVRPGGILVYSTCTTEPEENQDVVAAFLERRPDYRLVRLSGLPEALQQEVADEGWLQLWPHRHHTDGFFIAKMERVSG